MCKTESQKSLRDFLGLSQTCRGQRACELQDEVMLLSRASDEIAQMAREMGFPVAEPQPGRGVVWQSLDSAACTVAEE